MQKSHKNSQTPPFSYFKKILSTIILLCVLNATGEVLATSPSCIITGQAFPYMWSIQTYTCQTQNFTGSALLRSPPSITSYINIINKTIPAWPWTLTINCQDGSTGSLVCNKVMTIKYCGDYQVSPPEQCDHGNPSTIPWCTNTCTFASCVTDNDCNAPLLYCFNGTCKKSSCGDGSLQSPTEQCEQNSDCSTGMTCNTCQCEYIVPTSLCGNGIKQDMEQCDDGNIQDSDWCQGNCILPYCGDGIPDPGEQCDDGNTNNADACRTNCLNNICGDSIINLLVEQCDEGTGNSNTLPDKCRLDCQRHKCGDNILDYNEQCDDGNILTTDGCGDTCQIDTNCSVNMGDACDGNADTKLCGKIQCDWLSCVERPIDLCTTPWDPNNGNCWPCQCATNYNQTCDTDGDGCVGTRDCAWTTCLNEITWAGGTCSCSPLFNSICNRTANNCNGTLKCNGITCDESNEFEMVNTLCDDSNPATTIDYRDDTCTCIGTTNATLPLTKTVKLIGEKLYYTVKWWFLPNQTTINFQDTIWWSGNIDMNISARSFGSPLWGIDINLWPYITSKMITGQLIDTSPWDGGSFIIKYQAFISL